MRPDRAASLWLVNEDFPRMLRKIDLPNLLIIVTNCHFYVVRHHACIDLPHLKWRGLRLGFVQPQAQSRN